MKDIVHFFDRLEDKTRISLSHRPILYAIIGGIGIVLFWKGVWETASLFPFLNDVGSILLGLLILLMTGFLVSFFIGDSIMLSGFKHEKKLAEKTEEEVRAEKDTSQEILDRLDSIERELEQQGVVQE